MFGKHKKLFQHLDEYYAMAEECLTGFGNAVNYSLENGLNEHFERLVEEISEKEQNCDELRRTIEHEMFAQSLLPETREDLTEIIEMMDQIPNHCESVSFMMIDQRTSILPEIRNDLIELIKVSIDTFKVIIEAVHDCMGKMEKTHKLLRTIDDNENVGNSIERKMIRTVFSAESLKTHPGRQLIQKEVIKEIGEILDLCKHLAERIMITVIKRHI